ncbi:MAG TPA: acyl carrier protein [Thermoleophilaceae bacterium]|nr:acyl carrier protein [Thermoleophilaceae bacterium]
MSTETVSREQIESRVEDALVEFGAEREEIGPDAKFESLDVDSLDLVELAQIVEEDYGVQITGEDMKTLDTVGKAVDFVEARLS